MGREFRRVLFRSPHNKPLWKRGGTTDLHSDAEHKWSHNRAPELKLLALMTENSKHQRLDKNPDSGGGGGGSLGEELRGMCENQVR